MNFQPLDVRPPKSHVTKDYLETIYASYGGNCRLIFGNINKDDDLITFDPKYANVMQLLFGDWFMCFNEESAKRISARRQGQPGFNCITVRGDQYKSDGTLSGGDTSRSGGNRIQEINDYFQ